MTVSRYPIPWRTLLTRSHVFEQETHLAQLKALYPEALCLQLTSTMETPLRTPRQTAKDWQLVVTMPLLDGEAVGPTASAASPPSVSRGKLPQTPQKTTPKNPASCQAELVRRLVAAVEAHCLVHLERLVCLYSVFSGKYWTRASDSCDG